MTDYLLNKINKSLEEVSEKEDSYEYKMEKYQRMYEGLLIDKENELIDNEGFRVRLEMLKTEIEKIAQT